MSSSMPSTRLLTPGELIHPDIGPLIEAVAHTGRLARETVSLPGTTRTVDVIRPCDIETLLDQSADDPEQNLPYWAEIWPSGIGLAAYLLAKPELVADQPVLELGSGVGITAAIAMSLGARLVATDYAPESLILTRITCQLLTGLQPETRAANWRSRDADLLQADGSRWPAVLAADVLYEERDVEPVLDVFDRILLPGGCVLLADQDRRPANLALQLAANRGWRIESTAIAGQWADPKDTGVIVRVHEMRRSEPVTH